MARSNISFNMQIDAQAMRYFQHTAPQKLREARKKAVTAAGMAWADEAKRLTRSENHIDTGLYINSIGYATGEPNNPLYEMTESPGKTVLEIGADVAYAGSLEKRYALFARSLDTAQKRMKNVAQTQIKNVLEL